MLFNTVTLLLKCLFAIAARWFVTFAYVANVIY